MSKYIRFCLVISCLALPLLAQAKDHFVFTATPTFDTNLWRGDIQSKIYTIRNDLKVAIKMQDIEIKTNDGKTIAATAITTAPTNSCVVGTDLAPGASCNIQVVLQPLFKGPFNRWLRVAFNTRQVEILGPKITTTVNCDAPAPRPTPPTPTEPAPTPGPGSLYASTISAYAGVTNTGPSFVNGDVDLWTATIAAFTGFTNSPSPGPGTVNGNTIYYPNTVAEQVRLNAIDYYNSAKALACPAANKLPPGSLGGRSLPPGVYCFDDGDVNLVGALTLAGVDSNSSYTFQVPSSLTAEVGSSVILTGGVVNDNVTWAVTSAATLKTNALFKGIVVADAGVSMQKGATVGRAWALNGPVTLIENVVNPLAN